MVDLGAVQSFWGPAEDEAVFGSGLSGFLDFIDVMPSRYGPLKFLATGEEDDLLNVWKNGDVRIRGLQGFFFGTDSSVSIRQPGFSTALAQVIAASQLALRLEAEFLILGSPSSRVLGEASSEKDIRTGYFELAHHALDLGVPLLIENLPVSFDSHGLSSVQSLLALTQRGAATLGQIGFCLDLGNHFSYHRDDQRRAFSEARELLETGLVKHMQINLLDRNSLGWCLEFLRSVVDQSSLDLGLAVEVPDVGFDAGLTALGAALRVLRPGLSCNSSASLMKSQD